MQGLSVRQKKFCYFYLLHGNASKAAREAGYARSVAATRSHRLKANPKIKAFLMTKKSKAEPLFEKMNVNFEWKIKKLKQVIDSFIEEEGCLTPKRVSTALQAIAEMNKMQGHYSAEKHVNVDVKADTDFEALDRLVNQHAKDY